MPGEVDLAEEFGCARATVNRAMRELADEGFIDRKRKAGTRIKSSPTRHAKFAIPLIRDEIEKKISNESQCIQCQSPLALAETHTHPIPTYAAKKEPAIVQKKKGSDGFTIGGNPDASLHAT